MRLLRLAVGNDLELCLAIDREWQMLVLLIFLGCAESIFDGSKTFTHALGVVQVGLYINFGAVVGLAAFKRALAAFDALDGDA